MNDYLIYFRDPKLMGSTVKGTILTASCPVVICKDYVCRRPENN